MGYKYNDAALRRGAVWTWGLWCIRGGCNVPGTPEQPPVLPSLHPARPHCPSVHTVLQEHS